MGFSFTPKCPNHLVGMIRTDNPKEWICPVSSARFHANPSLTKVRDRVLVDGSIRKQHDWDVEDKED